MMRILVSILLLCLSLSICRADLAGFMSSPSGGTRVTEVINNPWKFSESCDLPNVAQPNFDDHGWQTITVPFTWNTKTEPATSKDAWFRTHVEIPSKCRNKEIFIYFEGVATIADVYLNGVYIGEHRGAYTRFIFDVTTVAHIGGDNVLAVKTDTDPSDTSDCLPAGDKNQLYRVYGGIYRKVQLLTTQKVHIDPTDDAASGLFLAPVVTPKNGSLSVLTLLKNDSSAQVDVTVTDSCFDGAGKSVAVGSLNISLPPAGTARETVDLAVPDPRLWEPGAPNLYQVTSSLLVKKQVVDEVTETTGFRTFRLEKDGIFLNGVLTPLRGVAKHEETEDHYAAVTNDDLRQDWASLCDLGVNYVRLPHYPHSELEYDLADQDGIVVWAENGHSNFGLTSDTGKQITREMIRQNYNHPSIFFWSVGNEAIGSAKDVQTVVDYATVARSEDLTRLIVYASNIGKNFIAPLDFVAVNAYPGWYGGAITDLHKDAAAGDEISETGAGGVVTTHTADVPTDIVSHYEPEEYQDEVAEDHFETCFDTPQYHVPLFTWWTFRDFNDPGRKYKGLNSKGLETYAGFKKDSYYLLQAYLKKTPVVHIAGKTWFLRQNGAKGGVPDIKAFSNAATLTLSDNGKVVGAKNNGDYVLPVGEKVHNVFSWPAPLSQGRNELRVTDLFGNSDNAVIYYQTGDTGLISQLTSSNPANSAYFIASPISEQYPIYDDFDGTADNTYSLIPPILAGAEQIVTGRLSKLSNSTSISFVVSNSSGPVNIFLVGTVGEIKPQQVTGFSDTHVEGVWRDNNENLVKCAIYRKTVSPGTFVSIPAAQADYVVMVKPCH